MRNSIGARFGWILPGLLAMPSLSVGEDICMTESTVVDHFESIEANYVLVSGDKVRFDIYLWGMNPTLAVDIAVYYGVPDDVDLPADLDDNFELKVDVAHYQGEDNLYAELFVDRDFSRLLIEVSSSYMKDGAATCGYSHVLAVGKGDLSKDPGRGELGPMTLIQ